MSRIIDNMVTFCVNKDYISTSRAPWLRYALEKKISSFLISIPVLLLGILINSIGTSISFFLSFVILRSRINGFHANSMVGCLIASLLLEILFLGFLYYIVEPKQMLCLLVLSTIVIFFMAPYNHPNMNLTDDEVKVCAKGAKIRVTLLLVAELFFKYIGFESLSGGISMGISMAAILLALAYIFNNNGGTKHEHSEQGNGKAFQKSH